MAVLTAFLPAGLTAAGTDRRLVDAAKRQDREAVRTLLKQRVDVNAPQTDGATALHWAAHWDDLETADLLIRAGANVQSANEFGITPLALACTNGNAAMIALLLKAGANPNAARTTGETPLMTASRTGNLEAVKSLLAHGAEVNAKEPVEGQTALMWAISERHADVVRVLVEAGADARARAVSGFTPLLFAARAGDLDSTRLLLDAGADVNEASSDGTGALLVATVRGHAKLAIFLLDRGADPNANRTGYTALHWAAGVWETELNGANGIVTPDDDGEWSALGGVKAGKLELVKALLAHGANPNVRLEKTPPRVGYTQLAVEQRVAGVNAFAGATPFLLAATAGDIQTMQALAAAGADPRLKTKDETTALMLAAGLGRYLAESRVTEPQALEAVKVIVELGADVKAANEAGNTALHGAAQIKANTVIEFLVAHGADVNAANKRGQTPVILGDTVRAGSATVASRTSTGDLLRRLGGK
ncbi:MAG TPA: ankyrin repeat domain-containing protein [Vicinamibacterales bacterium]